MTLAVEMMGGGRHSRRGVFLRYLLIFTAISMAWEFAQMPLYTLAATGTPREIIFSALHCTMGDALIGGLALAAALIIFGSGQWPGEGRFRVLVAALVFGLGYTIFSEWLNVEVRGAWAYSDLMPVVPVIGTGLSPLLQWLILPVVAHHFATREHSGFRRRFA